MADWFDLNDPARGDLQLFSGDVQDPGESQGPGPDAPPPPAAPAPPPGVGSRPWHNTPNGQFLIDWFTTTFTDIHKRPPTAEEMWVHLLRHEREPSTKFVQDILTNIRNSVTQQQQRAPAAANTPPGRAEGQSFRDYFRSLVEGKPFSQQTLLDLEEALKAAGSELTPPNASGERTKIWDPDSQDWVRVFGVEGDWQWIGQGYNRDGTRKGGDAGGAQDAGPPLLAPWTQPFEYPSFEPPPAFVAPTSEEAFNDEGFKFALGQGRQALERSAAAKGTLLTTGTLKDLDQFSQGAASQQYDKVYGRRLGEYESKYGHAQNDWAQDYNKALGEYRQAYDIFNNNQDRPFNKLAAIAGFGQTAGSNLLGAGQGYAGLYGNTLGNMGAQMGNYWTQGANAGAAGQMGGANAWMNGINQGLNFFAPWMYQSLWRPQAGQSSQYPMGGG